MGRFFSGLFCSNLSRMYPDIVIMIKKSMSCSKWKILAMSFWAEKFRRNFGVEESRTVSKETVRIYVLDCSVGRYITYVLTGCSMNFLKKDHEMFRLATLAQHDRDGGMSSWSKIPKSFEVNSLLLSFWAEIFTK